MSPTEPSPESAKLAESLVIVEFIAELFPESKLHPTDLVKRARARHFITLVETKFEEAFHSFFAYGASYIVLLEALEALLSVQVEQAAAGCRMPDTTEARICWQRLLRSR